MIEDILGNASWPAAIVAIVLAVLVAHGYHEDRQDRQQLRIAIVHECAQAPVPTDCAAGVKAAIRAAS